MIPSILTTLAPVLTISAVLAAAPTRAQEFDVSPTAPERTEYNQFLVIADGLQSQVIDLVEINFETLIHVDAHHTWHEMPLDRCIALLSAVSSESSVSTGMVILTDGQQLPGQAKSNAPVEDERFAWNHAWIGRLDIPLEVIRSLSLVRGATVEPGDYDRVLLANGDILDGLIVALGDPITLEPEDSDGTTIDVPLDRAVAVALISEQRSATGKRLWFRDGTVLDVTSVRIGDDGFVRLESPWINEDSAATKVRIEQIQAILINPGTMRPLAHFTPSRIAGPESRYRIAPPTTRNPEAPLGLSRIEFTGPIVTRYALPTGTRRFAAEAILPLAARQWGDYELLIYDDDRVVFRTHLNNATPTASINVEIHGSELTIQLAEGRYGPIQDRLYLDQAMLLVQPTDP